VDWVCIPFGQFCIKLNAFVLVIDSLVKKQAFTVHRILVCQVSYSTHHTNGTRGLRGVAQQCANKLSEVEVMIHFDVEQIRLCGGSATPNRPNVTQKSRQKGRI